MDLCFAKLLHCFRQGHSALSAWDKGFCPRNAFKFKSAKHKCRFKEMRCILTIKILSINSYFEIGRYTLIIL